MIASSFALVSTYKDASSAIVKNMDVVPIQIMMNPYTRPAGPPLYPAQLLCLTIRKIYPSLLRKTLSEKTVRSCKLYIIVHATCAPLTPEYLPM